MTAATFCVGSSPGSPACAAATDLATNGWTNRELHGVACRLPAGVQSRLVSPANAGERPRLAKRRAMYAAAESFPADPVARPSRASLARYRTSRMRAAVSGAGEGPAGAEAGWWQANAVV